MSFPLPSRLRRRPRRLLRLVALSATAIALFSVAPSEMAAQVVQGRVSDASTERGVPNSVVRLLNVRGDSRAAATTDSLGFYRMLVPAAGNWTLRAEQLGYDPTSSREMVVQESSDTVVVDLVLRPTPIPIRGVEVSTDRVNQRLRQFLGASPGQLRVRPIRYQAIRDQAMRGRVLSDLVEAQGIPNLRVLPGRTGPCYQHRGRGCVPVFLDGARLTRAPNSSLPLEMLGAIVILLPNELIAYPEGAVLLFTTGFVSQ